MEFEDLEKLECRTEFDLIRLSNSSGDLPVTFELLPVDLDRSSLFPVELGSSRFDFGVRPPTFEEFAADFTAKLVSR